VLDRPVEEAFPDLGVEALHVGRVPARSFLRRLCCLADPALADSSSRQAAARVGRLKSFAK